MQPHAILLALLPPLALAFDPNAAPAALYACTTLSGVVAKESCVFAALGAVPAAASYAASVDHDSFLSAYLTSAVENPAIGGDLTAAGVAERNSQLADLNFLGLEASVILQHITDVPSGTARDVASSVFAEINALQSTGIPAPAPAQTAGQTTPSKAFAPKQTGLAVVAGVIAGVAGVAVAL